MRKCVIILTPDEDCKANIETGSVTTLEILDAFKTLSSHFATKLCQEYTQLTGKSPNEPGFEEWVKFLRDSQL